MLAIGVRAQTKPSGHCSSPTRFCSNNISKQTRRKIVLQPEKRLMLAILKDAVSTFQADLFAANAKSSRRFEQAKDWISETDGDWVFSFQNICEHLGLNPAYVRNGLLRWMEKKLAKRQLDARVARKIVR